MDFGIGIATSSDSWKLAQRAEELGFTHAWFYDTQMITADCFVAMGAAAMKTSRIRLGTGVLVPSNRIAAVTANAFATLNGHGAGTHRFRRRHRLLRPPRHGPRRDEAGRHGGVYPRRLRPAERRDAGNHHRGQTAEDPLPQSRCRPDQHARSDPAARLRLRPEIAGADGEAGRRVEDLLSRRAGRADRHSSACSRAGRRPAAPPATSMPPPGPAAACWNRASRPTARAPWRRPDRARRCCCIARRISTWRAGRTPPRSRNRWKRTSTATSKWRAASNRRMRAT